MIEADDSRRKAVGSKQESASYRRVANSVVRKTTNKTQSAEGNVWGNS